MVNTASRKNNRSSARHTIARHKTSAIQSYTLSVESSSMNCGCVNPDSKKKRRVNSRRPKNNKTDI